MAAEALGSPRQRVLDVVRAMTAGLALIGLLLVLPWALVNFVGWPLPRQVPPWDELRRALAGADLVTDGRIVAAGALADQGDLSGAIRLLERAPAGRKRPEDHHLRLWYALADLYERVGETPRARDLFERVARHDPEFVDVVERRRALG